jgi:hypothetical protein
MNVELLVVLVCGGGMLLGAILLFMGAQAYIFQIFRQPGEMIPDATEKEPDEIAHQTFMVNKPSIGEIRAETEADMSFDEKVELYRNMEEDNKR